MEYQGSAFYKCGYSKTPGQSQQWGKDGNIFADPHNYGQILSLGTANRGPLSVDSNNQNHHKVHGHNDQGWDGKCQKGFGVVPVKPAGVGSHVAFLRDCDSNCGASNDQRAPVANGKADGHHAGLHHPTENNQYPIDDKQCFEEHPEKQREVEKVAEKCQCNTPVGVLGLFVKVRVYDEPHVSNQERHGDVDDAHVTHVGYLCHNDPGPHSGFNDQAKNQAKDGDAEPNAGDIVQDFAVNRFGGHQNGKGHHHAGVVTLAFYFVHDLQCGFTHIFVPPPFPGVPANTLGPGILGFIDLLEGE